MQKYELTQIGSFHTNHNEDSLITHKIGKHRLLIAVMDGCSMGIESHFASTLITKILKKIALDFYYIEFAKRLIQPIKTILKQVLSNLFFQLRNIKNELHLERNELLSTLILAIIDQKEQKAETITIGDGLISCNGTLTEYEQNNRPDYIGYHLEEAFEEWFAIQNQRLSLDHINDLSIATDGIFTFRKFDNKHYHSQMNEDEIITYLLHDQTEASYKNMLLKKLIYIEKSCGLKPSDDLSIIRLFFNTTF